MKKKIGWAIILILIAAIVIMNALGIMENVAWTWIIVLALLAYWMIRKLIKLDWEFLIPLSIAPWACIKADLIPTDTAVYEYLDQLTPWPLLIAGVLLAIAFNIIFKKSSVSFRVRHNGKEVNGRMESFEDGESVTLDNCFGDTSKYVNSNNMRKATIDNAFGQATVYFDNAILDPSGATITIDNSFGQTNVYLPATWRTEIKRETAFGYVKEHGMGNADADAPLVFITADNSFGEIDIFHN